MCNLWSAYHCPLRADSARQEDHYWDYSTTNWWPGDYSASSTTEIDWPVERAGERKKEVELGSVLVCKHLFLPSVDSSAHSAYDSYPLPSCLMKWIWLGIRIRYLGLMRNCTTYLKTTDFMKTRPLFIFIERTRNRGLLSLNELAGDSEMAISGSASAKSFYSKIRFLLREANPSLTTSGQDFISLQWQ